MAIAKPPAPRLVHDDRKANALIGRAANDSHSSTGDEKDVAVTVSVPASVLEQIDASVKARRVRTPRHAWLLEAIYEKLDREVK